MLYDMFKKILFDDPKEIAQGPKYRLRDAGRSATQKMKAAGMCVGAAHAPRPEFSNGPFERTKFSPRLHAFIFLHQFVVCVFGGATRPGVAIAFYVSLSVLSYVCLVCGVRVCFERARPMCGGRRTSGGRNRQRRCRRREERIRHANRIWIYSVAPSAQALGRGAGAPLWPPCGG